jgi:competence protein ComEC
VGAAVGVTTDVPVALTRWIAVALVPLAPWFLRQRHRHLRTAFVHGSVLLAAIFLGARSKTSQPVQPTSSALVTVEGTVIDSPIARISTGPDPSLHTYFSTTNPRLRVRVDGEMSDLQPGHRLSMRGRLVAAPGPRNPGEPSARNTTPRLYVPSRDLVDIQRYAPFEISESFLMGLFQGFVATIHDAVHRRIETLYAHHGAGVHGTVLALLMGDRRLLEPSIRNPLRQSGTAHFLAISGVHVGILFACLTRVPLPGPAATAIRLAILTLFALTAGASAPVLRAVLMLSLPCIAETLGRPMRALDGLSWAVIVLLGFDPQTVLDAGFQLSALAVFGIVTWTSAFSSQHTPRSAQQGVVRQENLSGGQPNVVRQAFTVSAAAFFGTAPLIAYYFQSLHPLGILWSVLLFPLIAVVLLGASLSLLLGTVHSVLGVPFAWFTAQIIAALEGTATLMASVPGSQIKVVPPPALLVLILVGVLVGGTLLLQRTRQRQRRVRLLWSLLAVMLCTALAHQVSRAQPAHDAWFFDVGAGSAQLLRGPAGESLLVDIGSSNRSYGLGSRLARSLLTIGVRHLDAIVLTHKDADHVNGILELIESVPTQRVFVTPYFENFTAGETLANALRERHIEIQTIERGTRLRSSSGWTLDTLYPIHEEALPLVAHSNESSMVLRFTVGGSSILLTADIEEEGTARLLSLGDDLRTDILVYPHHGRENRLMNELLDRVQPKWVVLSAAHDESARRTARILEERGVHVHATWRDRAGQAVLTPSGWTIRAWSAEEKQ